MNVNLELVYVDELFFNLFFHAVELLAQKSYLSLIDACSIKLLLTVFKLYGHASHARLKL